jgi:hypothetical protein
MVSASLMHKVYLNFKKLSSFDRTMSNMGTEWESEIDRHLNRADIILLLVSSAFMASEYCYSIEMKHAIERNERGEAQVIPIILRQVYWQEAPFAKLQVLPTGAKPVLGGGWGSRDQAFFNVTEEIRKALNKLLSRTVTKVTPSSTVQRRPGRTPGRPSTYF